MKRFSIAFAGRPKIDISIRRDHVIGGNDKYQTSILDYHTRTDCVINGFPDNTVRKVRRALNRNKVRDLSCLHRLNDNGGLWQLFWERRGAERLRVACEGRCANVNEKGTRSARARRADARTAPPVKACACKAPTRKTCPREASTGKACTRRSSALETGTRKARTANA